MKNKNIKKIILGSLLGILMGSLLGTTYAMFTYERGGTSNSKLITGNIYMRYKEDTSLTLQNAMPSNTYDSNYKFEFTIDGANTTTNKDVWYEIKVKRGDIPEATPAKTESDRIPDRFIKYTLVEEKDGVETIVVDGESWEGLTTGKTIWVDKIEKNKTSETHKYTLYMWLSNKIEIGNSQTADFTTENWNKAFASIKVDVNGDFTEKEVDEPYYTINAMNGFDGAFYQRNSDIIEIYFNRMKENAMQTSYDNATIKADLTYNNEGEVLAWLETNQTDNTKYNLIIASEGETYINSNVWYNFGAFGNLEKLVFKNCNISRLSELNGYAFGSKSKLKYIDFSSFNTSHIISMRGLFANCINLEYVDLSGFDMTHVENTNGMFYQNSNLNTIYVLSEWNISNVSDSTDMFYGCTSLVGGNGTRYSDDNPKDKTMAVIDKPGQPGYLTDIKDKPSN